MGTFKNPDVWKQNLAYQIGDFALYSGTVYMAIKPVPAGTNMSADYWIAYEEGAIVPTGEISITENGEVDVAGYATANVNVEGGGGGGGGSVGALVDVPLVKFGQVEIGDDPTGYLDQMDASRVKLGSDVVVEGECTITRITLGSTFEHDFPTLDGTVASAKMYDVTLAPNAREEMVISSLSEISGATNLETLEVGGDEIQRLTVNMPDAAPADSHAYVLEIIPAE